METLRTDAVVIGTGPGGYVAAVRLGQLGKKTLVIEREFVGGVCLNVGCIPSKALITASKRYAHTKHGETMGIHAGDVRLDVQRLQAWKSEVVNKMTGGVRQLLKSANAQTLMGTATFVAAHKLEVKQPNGAVLSVEADHIVIATGSRVIEIPGFPIDNQRILDSTGGLSLNQIPERLLVVGGGYIGLELGMMLAKFGTKVTVVEFTNQLLPGNDPDLVNIVARKLRKLGIETHLESKALGWEETGGATQVRVQTQEGEKIFETDKILVTVGRKPNSDGLGLENIGVKLERGFITVDKQQRTSVPGVYAIGDVAGQPMLAHKASKQGEVVAEVIAGHQAEMDTVAIPAVIFTDPEIATVGLQQHEAEQQGRQIKTGKYAFGALGRAVAMAETEGFVKIIADAQTDEVLGFALVGPEVSNLISECTLALEMGAFLQDIALTVHAHPTLPEAIMEAAKAALGESPHLVGGGQRRL